MPEWRARPRAPRPQRPRHLDRQAIGRGGRSARGRGPRGADSPPYLREDVELPGSVGDDGNRNRERQFNVRHADADCDPERRVGGLGPV